MLRNPSEVELARVASAWSARSIRTGTAMSLSSVRDLHGPRHVGLRGLWKDFLC